MFCMPVPAHLAELAHELVAQECLLSCPFTVPECGSGSCQCDGQTGGGCEIINSVDVLHARCIAQSAISAREMERHTKCTHTLSHNRHSPA